MTNGQGWLVSNRQQAENFCEFIMQQAAENKVVSYSIKTETRTSAQNAALHACFRRLAQEMNDAGYSINDFTDRLKAKEVELPWTESSVKEMMYKLIIKALYDTDSTTKLTSEQLTRSVDIMLGRVAELTGVVIGLTLQETKLLKGK